MVCCKICREQVLAGRVIYVIVFTLNVGFRDFALPCLCLRVLRLLQSLQNCLSECRDVLLLFLVVQRRLLCGICLLWIILPGNMRILLCRQCISFCRLQGLSMPFRIVRVWARRSVRRLFSNTVFRGLVRIVYTRPNSVADNSLLLPIARVCRANRLSRLRR